MTHTKQRMSQGRYVAAVSEDPAGEEMVARVRQRVDELVAMGYEQMLRERLVPHQPPGDKTRLKFLLL
ncbi:MAG TPA: hypothetical protein EYP43_04115 [Thermoplasmata archaeon]|nr:hypothetical protein [Thermoplasmata archaeon]